MRNIPIQLTTQTICRYFLLMCLSCLVGYLSIGQLYLKCVTYRSFLSGTAMKDFNGVDGQPAKSLSVFYLLITAINIATGMFFGWFAVFKLCNCNLQKQNLNAVRIYES
jgi:hypothetical protein